MHKDAEKRRSRRLCAASLENGRIVTIAGNTACQAKKQEQGFVVMLMLPNLSVLKRYYRERCGRGLTAADLLLLRRLPLTNFSGRTTNWTGRGSHAAGPTVLQDLSFREDISSLRILLILQVIISVPSILDTLTSGSFSADSPYHCHNH